MIRKKNCEHRLGEKKIENQLKKLRFLLEKGDILKAMVGKNIDKNGKSSEQSPKTQTRIGREENTFEMAYRLTSRRS